MKQCKILWKCSLSVVLYVPSTYTILNLDRWALGVWKAVQGCVVSKVLHSVSAFLDSSTLQLFFDLYHSIPPSFSPLVSLVFPFLTDSATRRCCRIHLGGLRVVKMSQDGFRQLLSFAGTALWSPDKGEAALVLPLLVVFMHLQVLEATWEQLVCWKSSLLLLSLRSLESVLNLPGSPFWELQLVISTVSLSWS